MRSVWLAAACAVVVSSTACGGASQGELFGRPSDGGEQAESGKALADSGTPPADTGAADSQQIADSAVPPDTAPPPPPDQDTGAPPSTTLPCGQGQPDCAAGGEEVCCVSGQLPNLSFNCTDESMCTASMGVPVGCASAAQCRGQICCGTQTGTGQGTHYVHVECDPMCAGIRFCDPNGDDCMGGACDPSTLLPGYYVCRL